MVKTDVNWLLNELAKKDQENPEVQLFTKGLQTYGYHKPIISPIKVSWDMTRRCNLECAHCSRDAVIDGGVNELSFMEIQRILINLKEFGIRKIAFSGGEFMVRPDYQEIIDLTVEAGMSVSLITNCTLVDEKVAKRWAEQGINIIQTSLDGATSKTHDKFRGRKGAFERTLRGVSYLLEAQIPVIASFTVSKLNQHELNDAINLCIERNIPAFTVNDLLPIGRGENLKELLLDNNKYLQLVDFFKKKKQEVGDQIYLAWEGVGNFDKEVTDIKRTLLTSQCTGCFTSCHITATGDVIPCNLLHVKAGNLREEAIKMIWEESQVFKDLRERDQLIGQCGACDFRYSCGGCRGRAYAYTGNYLASDPRCNYTSRRKGV